MGHSVNGRNLVGIISGWLVIKGILNLILGFGIWNIIALVVTIALCYFMLTGTKYMNYVTAVLVAAVVLKNLGNNIKNVEILYLIEAVIDAVCVFQLVANKDIREHFGQN